MDLFDLSAKLTLDSSGYESGISKALSGAGKLASSLGSGIATAAKIGLSAITAVAGAAAAFAGSAVKTGMAFDASMSQVAATMGTTVDQIQELRDFAQEMGRKTVFSATQAADALNYMALAGYDTEKSMAMLPTVLNLAASGAMDLARASDMVTDAESALGLTTEEAAAMVDQMAKTASKSNTSVEQLGDAMLTIGGSAQFMAGGTDRLATVLGILADNGIKGSEAGTHLRNMILKLSSPTKQGAAVIEQLGLEVFDANGNMRDMQDIILDLGKAMEGMTDQEKIQAISDLFNARDLSAVNALLGTSEERWNELGAAIKDSAGAAEQMAETQLDNLQGDITLLKSAFEGLQIKISDNLTPTLRDFVQFASHSLSGITAALEAGGIDAAINAVGEYLTEALNKIIEAAPKFVEAASKIIKALAKGLKKNKKDIVKSISDIAKTLFNALIEIVPEIFSAGGEIILELAAGFAQELPNVVSTITEGMDNIGAALTDEATLNKVSETVSSILSELISGLGEIISKGVEIAAEMLPSILSEITAALPDLLTQIASAIGQIGETIGNQLPSLIPSITEILLTFINQLSQTDVVGTFLDAASKILYGLIDGLTTALPQVLEDLPDIVQNIVENLLTHVDDVIVLVTGIITKLTEELCNPDTLLGLAKASVKIATSLIDGIIKAIVDDPDAGKRIVYAIAEMVVKTQPLSIIYQALGGKIPSIVGAATSSKTNTKSERNTRKVTSDEEQQAAADYISKQMGVNYTPAAKSAGEQVAEGFADGISSPASKQKTADAADAISETAVGRLVEGASDWQAAGGQSVNGLITGLLEHIAEVRAAAQQIADAAIQALEARLEIASPSKLAKRIGTFFSDGFANGIVEGIDAVRTASSELASAAEDGLYYDPVVSRNITVEQKPSAQNAELIELLSEIRDKIGGDVVIDGDSIVGFIDTKLGKLSQQKARAYT